MTLVVLLILAALWAVVLVPPLLRSRSERANDSIGVGRGEKGLVSCIIIATTNLRVIFEPPGGWLCLARPF